MYKIIFISVISNGIKLLKTLKTRQKYKIFQDLRYFTKFLTFDIKQNFLLILGTPFTHYLQKKHVMTLG